MSSSFMLSSTFFISYGVWENHNTTISTMPASPALITIHRLTPFSCASIIRKQKTSTHSKPLGYQQHSWQSACHCFKGITWHLDKVLAIASRMSHDILAKCLPLPLKCHISWQSGIASRTSHDILAKWLPSQSRMSHDILAKCPCFLDVIWHPKQCVSRMLHTS